MYSKNNIDFFRRRAKMTQGELAEKLGLSRQTISSYENGVSQPSFPVMIKLTEVLGVGLDDLFLKDLYPQN